MAESNSTTDLIIRGMDYARAHNKLMIAQHKCPVCGISKAHCKDPYRSLKQHIARPLGQAHELWHSLFWKVHYTTQGDKFMAKVCTMEDVEKRIEQYFGLPVLERLKGVNTINS